MSDNEIDAALDRRIQRHDRIAQQSRRSALPFYVLSMAPLLVLGWVGLTLISESSGAAKGIIVASAGVALSVILWNIGGTFRERSKASEDELERLENLKICFLAKSPNQVDSTVLFQALFPPKGEFGQLITSTSMRKSTAPDDES